MSSVHLELAIFTSLPNIVTSYFNIISKKRRKYEDYNDSNNCCHYSNCGGCVFCFSRCRTKKEKEIVEANLKRFDQLDFDAYSHRKNTQIYREIHCPDVKVVFPNGRTTYGIDQHVTDINGLFNGTPDSRITAHPIAFGSGQWTATTGILEATFSEPMKLPDGNSIPPTGNKVKIPMATIARWVNGCIAEDHLFGNNAEYMKQLGLGK